ncbi:MAG: biotin/lipoyl-containing protein [Candidatus Sumerlaeaceae bacterium]
MTITITMPQFSESMTEGKLLQWNVQVGDQVRGGDPIAEVEADKANMEIEAQEDGTVVELCGVPGDTIEVGTVLAVLEPGPSTGSSPEQGVSSPSATPVKASPLILRVAAQKGIPLHHVSGSGPGGQILLEDLDAYVASQEGSDAS